MRAVLFILLVVCIVQAILPPTLKDLKGRRYVYTDEELKRRADGLEVEDPGYKRYTKDEVKRQMASLPDEGELCGNLVAYGPTQQGEVNFVHKDSNCTDDGTWCIRWKRGQYMEYSINNALLAVQNYTRPQDYPWQTALNSFNPVPQQYDTTFWRICIVSDIYSVNIPIDYEKSTGKALGQALHGNFDIDRSPDSDYIDTYTTVGVRIWESLPFRGNPTGRVSFAQNVTKYNLQVQMPEGIGGAWATFPNLNMCNQEDYGTMYTQCGIDYYNAPASDSILWQIFYGSGILFVTIPYDTSGPTTNGDPKYKNFYGFGVGPSGGPCENSNNFGCLVAQPFVGNELAPGQFNLTCTTGVAPPCYPYPCADRPPFSFTVEAACDPGQQVTSDSTFGSCNCEPLPY